ncbi:MAG: CAAX prenyl protease-related protein [Betaproteobacteria bacterium]
MSPAAIRIIPFALYIAFLMMESVLPADGIGLGMRWFYAVKVVCVAIALGVFWRRYSELHTSENIGVGNWLLACAIGVVIFVIWIFLDQPWATMGKSGGWDPRNPAGEIIWPLATARLIGASAVVPVMEELFWRSLILRWIRNPNFLSVAPRRAGALALLVSSALFAVEHHQWLAGLLAGLGFGWIYMRTNNLWTAIVAHAVTNFMLGVWVLYTGRWEFW